MTMLTAELIQSLTEADSQRKQGQWRNALSLYQAADHALGASSTAPIKLNLALCSLGLSDGHAASRHSDEALAKDNTLWQAQVVKAKALRMLGKNADALKLLALLLPTQRGNPQVSLELGNLALNELGDAHLAQTLTKPFMLLKGYESEATLTALMSQLYDRTGSAEELTRGVIDFADAHLASGNAPGAPEVTAVKSQSMTSRKPATAPRKRVGLLSPLFGCSPVYFFAFGSLQLLADECDFIIFNRGTKGDDWASTKFRTIAREWFDVASLDSDSLAAFMHDKQLDVLVDMAGWMDPAALRALARKPARKMYKWVGGQSITTGLRVFDGMFSDSRQTHASHARLYTEPLIQLKSGYVTYTPPAYMPAVAQPSQEILALGVISNPAKVSSEFVRYLSDKLRQYEGVKPLSLRFIDKRYRYEQLQKRILSALRCDESLAQKNIAVEFITPRDHPEYLSQVGQLDMVIDTFPYTGGLTTVEALSLGVPCRTRVGKLFSERHTYAHCMYAGLKREQFDMEHWDINDMARRDAGMSRVSLLAASSKRMNHMALARELEPYLTA
jgi:protein O-GlcNAc transferase